MAEEVIHHIDDAPGGSGLNVTVGILLVFLAFIVLFLLFSRGNLFGGLGSRGIEMQVPSSIDVNLNK